MTESSRATPYTFMQSTRLVVTSRSSTASSPRMSTPSTASPAAVRSSPILRTSAGASTKSRSQETRIFIAGGPRSRELLEEAEVVLVEQPDVVDPVAHHGHAVDAQAEGEAAHLLGVVDHAAEVRVHRLEDGGVHHARAHDLEPARRLADAAALPAAHHAAEVHLDRRLRVGEERRPEA